MNHLLRIRNLREDHDFTQAYVASRMNIGQCTYTDYKNEFPTKYTSCDNRIRTKYTAKWGALIAGIIFFKHT